MHSELLAVALILALTIIIALIICAVLNRPRGHHAHHGGVIIDASRTTIRNEQHVHLHV